MDCQATSHFSVSQCDFPSLTGPISPAPIYVGVSCPAKATAGSAKARVGHPGARRD